MKNIRPYFEVCEKDISAFPPRYQNITCNIIFDVKMGENSLRKARFVADGYKTESPSSITYSTVVSRDSVCICLTIAVLNDLDFLVSDVENDYLSAP